MNPSRPLATHVAVRDGRILGVGALEELAGWGAYALDDRLAAKVLMPGLVEGHSHLMEGAFWRFVYCGYFDRSDPDGKVWPRREVARCGGAAPATSAGRAARRQPRRWPAGASTRSTSTTDAACARTWTGFDARGRWA